MKKLVLFDMDGTVYLENKLIDGANELFDTLQKKGTNYVFLTNNSSKNIDSYYEKIKNFGIFCTKDNFYSSIDVTINYLNEHKAKSIYPVGTADFVNIMAKHFEIVTDCDKNPDYIVLAFDRELTYKKIYDVALLLQRGVKYIATNPDLKCPISKDLGIPDCGSMAKLFECVTSVKPVYLGKPNPDMIFDLMKKYNLKKEEVILVGDRLYTDIACGYNAGIETVAVLTGETNLKEIEEYHIKPTYVLNSIKELPSILYN